jgi:ABC-type sugar transport system substrate-binding protein
MSGRSVVVSLPDSANEFQQLQIADAQQTAKRLGLELEVRDADGNAVLQIQQLFKFVHAPEPPRALLVEPVAEVGMERVAQKAAAAGIGFGLLNCTASYVGALHAQHPSLAVFTLGSDQVEIGRLQGRQMRRLLPEGGTALYLQGPLAASAARERLQGAQEVLAGARIETVVLDAMWTEESAAAAVAKWLRLRTTEGQTIDLVACQDDSMATGALRAFREAPEPTKRWGEIPFLGIDGLPATGQRMVAEGRLTATIVMPSNTGPALEALGAWMRTGTAPPSAIQVAVRSFPPEDQLAPRR